MQRGYDARDLARNAGARSPTGWAASAAAARRSSSSAKASTTTSTTSTSAKRRRFRRRMRDVIAAATRSNVSIYSIDPRGLTSLADESINVSGGFPDDPSLNLSLQSFQDSLRISQDSLRSLSEETGGFAAVNQNDFSERLPARRPGQQLVLRPRLLPEERSPRRPVQAHRGQGQAARPRSPVAPRLHGPAGKGAGAEGGSQRSDVRAGARGARQPAAAERHQAARRGDAIQGRRRRMRPWRSSSRRTGTRSTSPRRTASC